VVYNLEIAASKTDWHVCIWRLKAEASWVDNRHYRHHHSAVRQVRAASASVISQLDANEVIIRDEAAVACGLHACHHEAILG